MEIPPSELLQIIKQKNIIDLSEYADLKSLLYNNLFNKIPMIIQKVFAGESVFRTLPIYRSDLTVGRKKYLSYRPKEYNYPNFNRCSEPEQRHFYCSSDRHLSLSEVSYFLSDVDDEDPKFDKDYEHLEVGKWVLTRDLYLADLRFGSFTHKGLEAESQELKEKYKAFAKTPYIVEFFEYINQAFEIPIKKLDHLQYWLTACYSNYLLDDEFEPQLGWGTLKELEGRSEMSIDGILYHSVKGIQLGPTLQGYNMALRPEVIDLGYLQLTTAGITETKLTGEKEYTLDELIKIKTDISSDSWYYDDPIRPLIVL